MLGAAPEDMVMGAGDDLNCVELDIAKLFDDAENIAPSRGRGGEGLRIEPQPARVTVGYAKRG